MKKIHGIIPALVTPYDSKGEINEKALGDLVEKLNNEGVHGFYSGGSTAEGLLQSVEERKRANAVVAEANKGRAALIAHIGCLNLRDTIEIGKDAKKLGYDAISSLPPIYFPYTQEEIEEYYFDIVKETEMPLLVYNIPVLAGKVIDLSTSPRLFENDKIIGIKFTSSNFFQFERFSKRPDLIKLSGFDEMFTAGMAMGAHGAIGTTYNFMADKFLKMYNLIKSGDAASALEIQHEANEVIEALIKTGVMKGTKYIISQKGIPCGDCRRPFTPIKDEDKKFLDSIIEKYL